MMRDGYGPQVDAIGYVFEARGVLTAHQDGVAGVVHGPTQRVDVLLRLNAYGGA